MRDIPVFTTEYGVASLVLREIPYRREAYVHIRDVQPKMTDHLLEECASFCRMAGAERIFAKGDEDLTHYPVHCRILQMRCSSFIKEDNGAMLFPVTEETVGEWRAILNKKMESVDNAATLESRDEARILSSGGGYFIHEHGELLGVGWLLNDAIETVASCKRGAGIRVMQALMGLAQGDVVSLQVASTNAKAIALYEKLGFVTVGELSCWYRIG